MPLWALPRFPEVLEPPTEPFENVEVRQTVDHIPAGAALWLRKMLTDILNRLDALEDL